MSRSKKGSKGPGHDFWSKRPHSESNSKKKTKRTERQKNKSVDKLLKENNMTYDDVYSLYEFPEPCKYCTCDPMVFDFCRCQ